MSLNIVKLRCLVALAAVVILPIVGAVEYRFDPAVSVRTLFDDNLDMRIEGREIVSFGVDLAPELRATATSDQWQFVFDGRLNFIHFEDDVFSTDDQDVSLRMTRTTPLTVFQLDLANIRRGDVTAGVEDIDELARINERVDRQVLAPAFQWILSPKNRVVISGTVENTHYDATSFSDYDYNGVTVGWTHQYDERTVLDVNLEATDFEPTQMLSRVDNQGEQILCDVFGFNSDSMGFNVGVSRQVTERFSLNLSIGRRETDSRYRDFACSNYVEVNEEYAEQNNIDLSLLGFYQSFLVNTRMGFARLEPRGEDNDLVTVTYIFESPTDDYDPGLRAGTYLVDVGATYRGEKYSLDVTLARAIQPVGVGFLSRRDSVAVDFEYAMAEKLTARILGRYTDVSALEGQFSSQFGRENYLIQPSLQWRFTEQWTLNGGVRYRQLENEDAPGQRRDGLQVFAGARYKFKPKLLSR